MALPIPIWAVALVLAAIAPFTVKTIANGLDAKRRTKTAALLTQATKSRGESATEE